jgi:hypothetical protein
MKLVKRQLLMIVQQVSSSLLKQLRLLPAHPHLTHCSLHPDAGLIHMVQPLLEFWSAWLW